ncbi:MAG: NAD(+) diphosphatase [Lachnospiraceae bacterium]|nr:NAD(+) diphosphatase [Lachnospiraceae bacterium]
MIQDISPYTFDNRFDPIQPADESPVIICYKQRILCKCNEECVSLPTAEETETIWGVRKEDLHFLFRIDETAFFLCDRDLPTCDDWHWEHPLAVRGKEPSWLSFAAAVGAHLAHWYETSRFCGRCGHANIHSESARAMVCPSCGNITFPRINPIVIVAVLDGDRMLVARYNRKHFDPRNSQYVLLAGYVEIGESYEDTVRREIREETGLEVRNIRYTGSQPWPFSQTTIAGFYAEADSRLPLKMQKEELSELLWVSREDLPPRKNLTSMTDNLIEWFRHGLESCFRYTDAPKADI